MTRNFKLFLCFIFNACEYARGEIFTALSDIEPLLTTHNRVVDDLHDYINKEEERLHILKRYFYTYKQEHMKAMKDTPNYLGNPINAFTLIKRMSTDLEFVQLNIDRGKEHVSNISVTQYEDATYPSAEDLHGAARALTRLQETYLLTVEDLAEGILNGVIHSNKNDDNIMIAVSSKMSSSDCFEFGRILFNESDYDNALNWMMAALHKYKEENNFYIFEEIDILQYITLSHNFLGNHREALRWARKMVELDPLHEDASKYIIEFQKIIEHEEISKLNGEAGIVDEEDGNNILEDKKAKFIDMYNALCRGDGKVSPVISKELKCIYFQGNYFLKLAPIKMEYMYHNPDIVLFHEVLSDEEIETLKKLAQPRLKRALVFHVGSSGFIPGENRISKSAWLTDAESPVVARVSRRVADFTGLNMDTAEHLQVVNYGIGGHYSSHYDYADSSTQQFPETTGNRIATVLFYVSDVAQGGATVFPRLGLSVFPVRGAAVVWLNLHASGEGNRAMAHAACPVLRGSKWVSNKWIHLVGQEFRKPCGLEYQAEDMIQSTVNFDS